MASHPNLLFPTFLFLLLAGDGEAATLSSQTPAAGVLNTTEFIRQSCNGTLYPSLCFTSLVGYASVVQQSDARLSQVASDVTFVRVRSVSSGLSGALASTGPAAGPRLRAALHDCADLLGDAAELTGQAAEALRGVENLVGPEVAWRVSNAMTWMSAALTDEDTCTDEMEKLAAPTGGDCWSKAGEVYRRVRKVEKHTSIALALIHKLGF
ncbi:21 kDa protein-like [Curcuma longa]|uniref:21 kDa protein-like n=1 Tax=Curcuma longa TaxID=136217 RepID=UPI003D9E1739